MHSVIVRDLDTNTATPMEIITNAFCSSGHHFPNGSWATYGGNGAIAPGGNIGSTIGSTGTGMSWRIDPQSSALLIRPFLQVIMTLNIWTMMVKTLFAFSIPAKVASR